MMAGNDFAVHFQRRSVLSALEFELDPGSEEVGLVIVHASVILLVVFVKAILKMHPNFAGQSARAGDGKPMTGVIDT